MVLLNTAAALVAADAALSLADGLEAAARSIDDGRARDTSTPGWRAPPGRRRRLRGPAGPEALAPARRP